MNPFADLIPTKAAPGGNPFSDLIPQKPSAPLSGWSPEEVAEVNARQPKPPEKLSVGDAFWKAATDPVGALGDSASTIYQKLGGSEAWGNRLGRDVRDLIGSVGPLGVEFAGAPSVPRTIAQPKPTPMPRQSVRTSAELKSTGGARMQEAKTTPSEMVPPEEIADTVAKFKAGLNEKALVIDPDLYSTQTVAVANRIEQAATRPQSLTELHTLRQLADDIAAKPGTEGKIGMEMKTAIDDMIAKHPEGAKFAQGKSEYARAMKAQVVEDALKKASTTAQWNRGDKAGAIRNAVKPLLNNKGSKRLWTPEEEKALRQLSRFTGGEMLGAFGSQGYMGLVIGRLLETMLFGSPNMALFAAGAPFRAAANARRVSRMEGIAERIRAGGPVQASRLDRLSNLFRSDVLEHLMSKAEGAKRVTAWVRNPTVQTARALASYTSARLNVPQMTDRILAELQGTEQTQAGQQNQQ